MKNGLLTVIVPAYNEQDNISAISAKVKAALEPRASLRAFVCGRQLVRRHMAGDRGLRTDGAVRGLRFSWLGKEGAMFAGWPGARQCVALIDADTAPPEALGACTNSGNRARPTSWGKSSDAARVACVQGLRRFVFTA